MHTISIKSYMIYLRELSSVKHIST